MTPPRVRRGLGSDRLNSSQATKLAKATALKVARIAFEGLGPLLIENGVTAPEAEALLRAVCVHLIADQEESSGRKPNVSRISIKTGVDRHTVATLLRNPPEITSERRSTRDPLRRVINGWLADPEYSSHGAPLVLDLISSDSRKPTAWSLVRKYAPGIWPRLVIDELIRLDYVDTLPNSRIRWKGVPQPIKSEPFINNATNSDQMRFAARALFHDLTRPPSRHKWRTVQTTEIDKRNLPLVKKLLRQRLNSTLAWITDELSSRRWNRIGSQSDSQKVRVGISGFTFEEQISRGTQDEAEKKIVSKIQ